MVEKFKELISRVGGTNFILKKKYFLSINAASNIETHNHCSLPNTQQPPNYPLLHELICIKKYILYFLNFFKHN